MNDELELFEKRKKDHIDLALDVSNQAQGQSGLDRVQLIHEALPELDLEEVQLKSQVLGMEVEKPLLISSMTAGHSLGIDLNLRLALAAQENNWLMGVGSQRRELFDSEAAQEWKNLKQKAPRVILFGNIGIAQLIQSSIDEIKKLVDVLEAKGLIVHLNPLQESLQPEGTPQFKGGLKALEKACREINSPVVVKETGCGFSEELLKKLKEVGVSAVDVSGLGGTHWGRIEGQRSAEQSLHQLAAETFANWGISTVDSMLNANSVQPNYEIWASGGVRTGLDVAKLFALGAKCVGLAKPLLEAAIKSQDDIDTLMKRIEFEIKIALFCTGSKNPDFLRAKKVWKWNQK